MKLIHFGKVVPGEVQQKAWFSVLRDRDSWLILIALPGKKLRINYSRNKIMEHKSFIAIRLEFSLHWAPMEDL